jgi:hypothetical protein
MTVEHKEKEENDEGYRWRVTVRKDSTNSIRNQAAVGDF